MNNRRSASVGALPVEKKHFVSRNESASGALLDVRCACQYFQCESLLPDKINPVDSRPTSKQGYVSDMDHGDHQHFDNMSTRSFNMMAKHPEFDRISASSFGGRMQGMDGRGLIVRSISDATEQEMVSGMMAGHRGRQMSIGGMSSGSRDPDAVSIRSGISLRRISRSPSRADLFVADLNIPLPHMAGQPRRGSRGEIPRLNIVAPTPTPVIGNMSPPDFSIYDHKATPSARSAPNRWTENNKENHAKLLPQNKPIDVSRYLERDELGRIINEQMDVDIEATEPVIDIKDNIRIDTMSPPLQQNVPDLSPVVEDETRIEITDFAPQPDLRPIDEILADDRPPGELESMNASGSHSYRPRTNPSLSQLKRQRAQERGMSPDYSKKQLMHMGSHTGAQSFQRGSSPAPVGVQYMDTSDFTQGGTLPRGAQQYGSGAQSLQRESSPAPTNAHRMDTKQVLQRGSGREFFQRASSPESRETQHVDAKQFMQYGSAPSVAQSFQRASSPAERRSPATVAQSFQRASSPAPGGVQRQFTRGLSPTPAINSQAFQSGTYHSPTGMHYKDTKQSGSGVQNMDLSPSFQRASSPAPASSKSKAAGQPFQRASSPAPASSQATNTNQFMQAPTQSFQRASSPGPGSSQHMNTNQFMQTPTQSFQKASSPAPTSPKSLNTNQFMQRASSPVPPRQFMQRGSPPSGQYMDTLSVGNKPPAKPHEDKQSYSSRFMSMFHSKTPDQTTKLDTPPQETRKLSISKLLHVDRGRSPSPGKQLKPESSPTPSRLMSVFKREKYEQPTAMSVIEGSHVANVSIRKPPEKAPHTVKVTETFSLKVDEMDQYSTHPPKSPSPVRNSRLYASSEQLGLIQDRLSESMDFYGDRQEAFAPIVLSSARSSQIQLQAGDRSHYMSSSQADLTSSRRFDSHEHIPPSSNTITFGNNKKLISVPIAFPEYYDREVISSEFIHEEPETRRNYSQPPRTNLIKAPSEQRLAQSKLLQRKSYISDRTQSHDRAAADRASELDNLSISTRSMSKTVSFNFGEHGSRLSQHEKMLISSNNQLDNKHLPERTYFSR